MCDNKWVESERGQSCSRGSPSRYNLTSNKSSSLISWLGGPFVFLYMYLACFSCLLLFLLVVKCLRKERRGGRQLHKFHIHVFHRVSPCFTANALDRQRQRGETYLNKNTHAVERWSRPRTNSRHSTVTQLSSFKINIPLPPLLINKRVSLSSQM